MNQDQIARVCHEVNRAYCQAIGDFSQPSWEDAPEWQRESARAGVDLHLSGDFGPEASHISWMKQKVNDGWVYGPVKDPDNKQHPCIVPQDILDHLDMVMGTATRSYVLAIYRAADDGGTIQAEDMLVLFPGEPELHTCSSLRTALLAAGCREEE